MISGENEYVRLRYAVWARGPRTALASLSALWFCAAAFAAEPLSLPGRYRLDSGVMAGTLELRIGIMGCHALLRLTQRQSGHTAELEGPARIEGNEMVMSNMANDGAELSITLENGRAVIQANEQAQMLYSGQNAVFSGLEWHGAHDGRRLPSPENLFMIFYRTNCSNRCLSSGLDFTQDRLAAGVPAIGFSH